MRQSRPIPEGAFAGLIAWKYKDIKDARREIKRDKRDKRDKGTREKGQRCASYVNKIGQKR